MNGLRSDYLEKLVRLCVSNFQNVVACDQLTSMCDGDRFICNLDRSFEKGSHYIALAIQNGKCVYFDSYGFPCLNEHIEAALIRNNISKLYYSKKTIQNGISLFCGYFCLAFLICDEKT